MKREYDFWFWLAKKMPEKLVYFCFIRVFAYSTTGKYGNTLVPEITCMKALDRYGKDKGVHHA